MDGDRRERERGDLGGSGEEKMVSEFSGESELVHNPVGFLPFGGSPCVENQGFLHAQCGPGFGAQDFPVFSGRLPVPGFRRPVRS